MFDLFKSSKVFLTNHALNVLKHFIPFLIQAIEYKLHRFMGFLRSRFFRFIVTNTFVVE